MPELVLAWVLVVAFVVACVVPVVPVVPLVALLADDCGLGLLLPHAAPTTRLSPISTAPAVIGTVPSNRRSAVPQFGHFSSRAKQ
jgi:hypothetical protein